VCEWYLNLHTLVASCRESIEKVESTKSDASRPFAWVAKGAKRCEECVSVCGKQMGGNLFKDAARNTTHRPTSRP